MKFVNILFVDDNLNDQELFYEYIDSLPKSTEVDIAIKTIRCLSEISENFLKNYQIIITDLNLLGFDSLKTKEFWEKYKPKKSILVGFSACEKDLNPPFDYFISKEDGFSLLVKLIDMQSKLI